MSAGPRRRGVLLAGALLAAGCRAGAIAPTPSASPASPAPAGPASSAPVATRFDDLRTGLALIGRLANASRAAGIVSNNGGRIVSQGGNNLVSNNGAALVSNNGGALVSNNGAAIVSSNGAGIVGAGALNYRLAQAGFPTYAEAEARIGRPTAGPAAGERPRRALIYANGDAFTLYGDEHTGRGVAVDPAGAITEQAYQDVAFDAAGERVGERRVDRFRSADGQRLWQLAGSFAYAAEAPTAIRIASAWALDAASGLVAHVEGFDLDLGTGSGSFTVAFGGGVGLREAGTLAGFARTGEGAGGVGYSTWDPLDGFAGESRVVDAAGALVCTKRQAPDGFGGMARSYAFPDGLVITLGWASGAARQTGWAARGGTRVAEVAQDARIPGVLRFDVTPLDPADAPFTIQVGGTGAGPAAATPTPAPSPAEGYWRAVHPFAGQSYAGFGLGAPGETGLAPQVYFDRPAAIAIRAGRAVVLDAGNGVLRDVPVPAAPAPGASPPVVTHAPVYGVADRDAAPGLLDRPRGLALAPDGAAYVLVADGAGVAEVRGRRVTRIAGGDAPGSADGEGGAARFRGAEAIARDDQGRLWVADAGNGRVRVLEPAGGRWRVRTATDPAGRPLAFGAPCGIVAAEGRVWVADREAGTIDVLDADGGRTRVAGSGERRHLDGPALAAGFEALGALARGADGTLWATDLGSRAIRRIEPGGQVLTAVGGALAALLAPSPRLAADDFMPTGVAAIDGGGFVYAVGSRVENLLGLQVPAPGAAITPPAKLPEGPP